MRSSRSGHAGIGRRLIPALTVASCLLAGCGAGSSARSASAPDPRATSSVPSTPATTTSATVAPTTSTTLVPAGLSPVQIGTWKLAAPAGAALRSLAAEQGLPPVDVITGRPGPHVEVGPETDVAISPAVRATLAAQLEVARAAAARLTTPAAATAAGYVPSAPFAPGDGVHWVRWDYVTQPFHPARPSMLLFSDTTARARLIAFSYYNRSAGSPPAGFAGPNDQWHQHRGLCITAGRTVSEGNAANVCGGIWLNGADLWMLHAWIVPGETNAWGRFAPIDPKWCLDIPGCGPNPLPGGQKP